MRFSFQVNVRRSRRHTFKTMRYESRQDGNSRHVFESVAKRLVFQVRLCAAPGPTAFRKVHHWVAAQRFKWLALPRATPRLGMGRLCSFSIFFCSLRWGCGHEPCTFISSFEAQARSAAAQPNRSNTFNQRECLVPKQCKPMWNVSWLACSFFHANFGRFEKARKNYTVVLICF